MNSPLITLDSASSGTFTAVMSTPQVDLIGETILPGAFKPLPASVPLLFGHKADRLENVIGRMRPFYQGSVLMGEGRFASTPSAQMVRQLIAEGIIDGTSVGYGQVVKAPRDRNVITGGRLMECSIVPIPCNPGAGVVELKAWMATPIAMGVEMFWLERDLAEMSVGAPHRRAYDLDLELALFDLEAA